MGKGGTPELALRLIEENKRTKEPYLDLGNCGLTYLPKQIEDCLWLQSLILSSTWAAYNLKTHSWKLRESKNTGVPNKIYSISRLEKLINLSLLVIEGTFYPIQKNPLFPLKSLKSLTILNCSSTSISDISALIKVKSLQVLSIRSTKVSNLSSLSELKRLESIDCSSTLVSDLAALSKLPLLQKLICHSTAFSDLSAISNLKLLKLIDCSNTLVSELRPLEKLVALEQFNAEGCPIKDCPADVYESGDSETLRAFFLRESLEQAVIAAGPEKTKALLRFAEEYLRYHDVKLILLGNSDAGKTSLLHYLKTGNFLTKRNSTHGLEVHRWLPDKKRFPSLSNVAVSIWDFGGQEYYHDAYRLFMSANAAYMLLWDTETNCNGRRPTCLKSGEKEQDLEHFEVSYWLDTVCYYCGDPNRSPLMVVQNKTDKSGKNRLSQDLHNEYVIDESFHISLKCGCDDNEVNHLRESNILRHFDAELEHALLSMVDKTGLPEAWLKVRSSLLDLQEGKGIKKNPFAKKLREDGSITLSGFTTCCGTLLKEEIKEEIKEDEARSIATTLERGGVLVYFEDSEILKDRVFLKPANLAERIYDILKTDVLNLGGEFTLSEVFTKDGDKDFQQTFIEATQNLGLVFPHPNPKNTDGKAYIAPQYLPESHAIEDLYKIASHGTWQSAYWAKVPLFYYKKLLHKLVLDYAAEGNGTEARYFWKHGIFFLKNGLRVLVKGLYPCEKESEGILHIGVEQSSNGDHLAIQCEIFEKVKALLFQQDSGNTPTSKKHFNNPPVDHKYLHNFSLQELLSGCFQLAQLFR